MRLGRAIILILVGACAAAIVAAELTEFRPLLLLNPTDSAARGLYFLEPADRVARGDLVSARLPEEAAELAAERGYLPLGLPVIKTVWAAEGDRVCAEAGRVSIPDRPDLIALPHDRSGRSLPLWSGCRILNPGEVFLASDEVPSSFDSRYFGPVSMESVLGRAVLLWSRPGRTEP
jgi:conjugative transfer signal peptidase TraF